MKWILIILIFLVLSCDENPKQDSFIVVEVTDSSVTLKNIKTQKLEIRSFDRSNSDFYKIYYNVCKNQKDTINEFENGKN